MVQLTGTVTGTPDQDNFAGSINNDEKTVVDGVVTGIAVEQLILDTFDGNDRLTATTNFFAQPFLPALAIGMTNADVNTGAGKDKVTVSSEGNSLEATISTGVQNAFIETAAGRDSIIISSNGKASFAGGSIPATSTGVKFATIDAGADNDSISVTSFAAGTPAEGRGSSTDTGIDQSTLLGGDGRDTIFIQSKAMGNSNSGADVTSTGATGGSSIQGGGDRDKITVSAIAEGGNAISRGSIAVAKGISDGTVVDGGDGNDDITIAAISDGGTVFGTPGPDGGTSQAYGASDAFINGGAGRDFISIASRYLTGGPSPDSLAYGILNTTVDGGSGSDTILVSVVATDDGGGGDRYGAANSTITGGAGRDNIVVSVELNSGIENSVGLLDSTIDGGVGNDTIRVAGLKLDLQDSLILGGGGQDTFDTGIGTATILGGRGIDLLKLDFFDGATMTIQQQGANGLEITGTQDKTGASADWTQTIFGVESYEVAGAVYDAASVVELLS